MISILSRILKRVHLHITFALLSGPFLAGSQAEAADVANTPATKAACAIFAGGVAGVADLTVSANSAGFRAAGGGLYLHNNGWGSLNVAQRKQVLEIFSNAPVAIERDSAVPKARRQRGPRHAGITISIQESSRRSSRPMLLPATIIPLRSNGRIT